MRVLILLAAIVLLLALVGWLSFTSGPGRSSINIETEEIRQDTQEVMQSGAEVLEDAGAAVKTSGDTDRRPSEARQPIDE